MTPFDLLESPLAGTNLIEASAGTGKTYAIAGLFVRLVLEKGFSVREILVVTFTEAATEELRDRIRKRIKETLAAVQSPDADLAEGREDAFLAGLLRKISDRPAAERLLREALRDFDLAPIFTIHGFCRRVLHENSFESGSLFDTELIRDPSALERQIVEDFWRRHFYEAPLEFIAYARGQGYSPAKFHKLLREGRSHASFRIVPEPRPVNLEEALDSLERYRSAADGLSRAWPAVRAEVLEKLHDPALSKVQYKNPPLLALEMDDWVRRRTLPLPRNIRKFSSECLRTQTRKNCAPPEHPFFALGRELELAAEALSAQMRQALLTLKGELFEFARKELSVRKRRRNVQSFDDLLTRLDASLNPADPARPGPRLGEGRLARRIRKKFPAALIDEFQDTDPVQYAIFRNIFAGGGGILFLIGDPKQAIYSFRGADLFAYMRAADHVNNRYTLRENRRSEPGLIAAINAVFSGRSCPFLFEAIPFENALAPQAPPKPELLTIDGRPDIPFHLWHLDGGGAHSPDQEIAKSWAYEQIPPAVAREIARIIRLGRAGRARIGERAVRESDIAVLVRENNQAPLIQKALAHLKIPAVLFSMADVFSTAEAAEMQRVLAAAAEPEREELVRSAIATEMIGIGAGQIEACLNDDARWEAILVRFREYGDLWKRRGFIRMFRQVLDGEKIRQRLLGFPDGERRLTNVLQIAEGLHRASSDGKLGPSGLVTWLARRLDPDSEHPEEDQLRLESDAEAVKIVTMHKSKGLEYPIVFCPFNWDGSTMRPQAEAFAYHDPTDDWRLKIAVDPKENPDRRLAEREILAENLRLFYVSVTRAKNRCYLVWGRFHGAGTSAPAYLLHGPGPGDRPDESSDQKSNKRDDEDILTATSERFESLTDAEIRRDLEALARRSGGSLAVSPFGSSCVPREVGPEGPIPTGPCPEIPPASESEQPDDSGGGLELSCRRFEGERIRDGNWQVASFSALLSQRAGRAREPWRERELTEGDLPGRDATGGADIETEEILAGAPDIFRFPGGTRAGVFFHELLQELDFTERDEAALRRLIAGKLGAHGFEPGWLETIHGALRDLVSCPLDGREPDLVLGSISAGSRLNELEFYFPLKPITPQGLRAAFGERYPFAGFPDRIETLNFRPASGFMKGYIDLVFRWRGRFFLVDWKSNLLGSRLSDYAGERLTEEMINEYYVLQYHLYTLALDAYLRTRISDYDYDRHFGGVYYLFLRGVAPRTGPDCGIFKDRPPKALIESLRHSLMAGC